MVGLRDRDRKCTAVVVAAPDFSPVDPVLYMMGKIKKRRGAGGELESRIQGASANQTA